MTVIQALIVTFGWFCCGLLGIVFAAWVLVMLSDWDDFQEYKKNRNILP